MEENEEKVKDKSMANYHEILKVLHDNLGWNLTDSLTDTGKKLVFDTLRAQEIIKNNNQMETTKKDKRVSRLLWLVIGFLLATMMFACSNDDGDDCQAKKDQINQHFDAQVEYVMNNPEPGGVDYNQISLLEQERSRKLSEACN